MNNICIIPARSGSKRIKNKNIKVFFGGTFSANSLSSFVGNETLKFLLKNKALFSNLNKKMFHFICKVSKK